MNSAMEATLKTIFDFGGYVTSEYLCQYNPERSYLAHARTLQALTLEKYLAPRVQYRLGKQPVVYQVTQKTCSRYGHPNSFIRNLHNETYIKRSLLRSRYLYNLVGSGYQRENVLCSNAERIEHYLRLGIEKSGLPTRPGSSPISTQIEEYVFLRFPISEQEGFGILYAHKPHMNPRRQLTTLLKKYAYVILGISEPLHIIIICEYEGDALAYQRVADSMQLTPRVSVNALALGETILARNYA